MKGGDFRSREANVYRLAQISVNIIDQCVAQGVPFAREYGGLLDTRSFGGVQVSRTFYARGQTGQQLLLGAYQALEEQIAAGSVKMHTRSEMLDLVVVERQGARHRHARSGDRRDRIVMPPTWWCWRRAATATFFIFRPTPRRRNTTAIWRAHRRGALFGNPCFTQIHPDVHSGEQRKSVQADADVRIAAQRRARVGSEEKGRQRARRSRFPEDERDYYLERRYPSFGNLVPRDVASRNAKEVCDEGRGVGPRRQGVYLDFARRDSPHGRGDRPRKIRQPLRHVRRDHRRKRLQGSDAHLSRRRTTRWAACGWITN